ncbi:SRPBCC family protein [Kribbella italica]|uniref:Uncharacterized protein YndB with AHSA1/START domain n=1 Tax=Kribbella italica TaxID=1540520 RepID=A0A7W9J694_9ACTN|nr:SRPBCC family protein [Kribbella italica]MBB5835915.1 uncharacterized protein YndB with AHSA1/START domain [Kribbella italica]
MSARGKLLKCVGVAALGAVVSVAVQPAAMAGGSRPAPRNLQACGGVTVDRKAPVISTASVVVKAPLTKIWRLHTDVDQWSQWIPEITPAKKKTPGPLRAGSVFEWSPQNMKVESKVVKVKTLRCTAWGAPVNGITGVHLFTFKPVRGGVLVTTEESWAGPPVDADVAGAQASLDAGLKDWVLRLKTTAEKGSVCS